MRKDTKDYEKINKLIGIINGERRVIKTKKGKFYRSNGYGDFNKRLTSKDNSFDFKNKYMGTSIRKKIML